MVWLSVGFAALTEKKLRRGVHCGIREFDTDIGRYSKTT